MTLSEISRLIHGTISGGGDAVIDRVAKIEDAAPGDITFLANPKYRKYLATTNATAVLVQKGSRFHEIAQRRSPLLLVEVDDPYRSFLVLLDRFYPTTATLPQGIHPTAVIAPSTRLGDRPSIGAYVVIGERCTIGRTIVLHPGTIIGDDVEIGDGSLLYANVTVREGCKIGKRAIIHPGTVIGSDGFGFARKPDGSLEKIPQRGIVVLDDDVEIGANCTIDRATLGETRIHKGVKLDNLVQVAHNVVIGEHTVIAAQTGISGSTKIGKYCTMGGQVGLAGHLEIADHTTLGAQSGVVRTISEGGKTFFGYPAREIRETMRIEACLRELPEMMRDVRTMQERLSKLEQLGNEITKATTEP